MSRIDELLAEYCPNGVQFQELDSVIKLNFGSRITKLADAGFVYPVYGGGGESFRTDDFNREDEYVVSRFAMSAKCVRKVNGKFWMLDSGFTFDPRDESVDKDFIAYHLFNMQRDIYECSSQGAQKNLRVDKFKRFRVAVPPLVVQREIVRILDQFTELEAGLEAELEAELEARRLQYVHFRDALFTHPNGGGIEQAPLGALGHFVRGRRFTKSDVVETGIPSMHYGEIYTHYGVAAQATVSQVRTELISRLRFAQPGDVVLAAVGETVEDVGKAVAWLGDGEVAVHDDCFIFSHDMDPKFVSYYMQTEHFHVQKAKHVARAKVKRLSGESLAKITMPVIPRAEQERIVAALDKYEALVKELSMALPAELGSRRKQYEHYRDRLLTFKELTA